MSLNYSEKLVEVTQNVWLNSYNLKAMIQNTKGMHVNFCSDGEHSQGWDSGEEFNCHVDKGKEK